MVNFTKCQTSIAKETKRELLLPEFTWIGIKDVWLRMFEWLYQQGIWRRGITRLVENILVVFLMGWESWLDIWGRQFNQRLVKAWIRFHSHLSQETTKETSSWSLSAEIFFFVHSAEQKPRSIWWRFFLHLSWLDMNRQLFNFRKMNIITKHSFSNLL